MQTLQLNPNDRQKVEAYLRKNAEEMGVSIHNAALESGTVEAASAFAFVELEHLIAGKCVCARCENVRDILLQTLLKRKKTAEKN